MITYKKNTVCGLISLLLLLLSSTIMGMEIIKATKPTRIKNLKRKRDNFINELTKKYHSNIGTLYNPTATYFYPIYNAGPQDNLYERVTDRRIVTLPLLQGARMEGYSALGMVVMAIKYPLQKNVKLLIH